MVVPNCSVHVEDEAAHVLLLLDVHAGHRLVQQQHRRLGRQRARQLHALLQAVRQAPHRRLADGLDLEEVDDLLHLVAVRDLLAPRRAPPQRLRDQPVRNCSVAAGHDVVQHGHALEQRDVLERARNALPRGGGGMHLAPLLAPEHDAALLRVIDAVDHVQHRTLARAVGADDRADLVLARHRTRCRSAPSRRRRRARCSGGPGSRRRACGCAGVESGSSASPVRSLVLHAVGVPRRGDRARRRHRARGVHAPCHLRHAIPRSLPRARARGPGSA